ncbi:MAG: AMP nucleosidase, partial [Boseongicola sp. SB0675_bin_26]|nr:AMP nucleosidase [Boseongicola sp. SB0675_bin_26]
MTGESQLAEAPESPEYEEFAGAGEAVERLIHLYQASAGFLRSRFDDAVANGMPRHRVRAYYPELRLTTKVYATKDTRLSFGHVIEPGRYSTTITRPELFRNYLIQQIGLLIEHHRVPVQVGVSTTPIPVHFAVAGGGSLQIPKGGIVEQSLRDVFDVPELATINDDIVNGHGFAYEDGSHPLAPFTAQRIDYSLARLSHYMATDADHFQNYVLFTNYQFYVD